MVLAYPRVSHVAWCLLTFGCDTPHPTTSLPLGTALLILTSAYYIHNNTVLLNVIANMYDYFFVSLYEGSEHAIKFVVFS